MTEELLEMHDRHSRLRAVDAEGVAEVMDRGVGLPNPAGVPAAIAELRDEARPLKDPPR